MSKKGRKDKKPRFRRTYQEIRRGLTLREARKERIKKLQKRKATTAEKVELIKAVQSGFGIDIASPPPEPIVLPSKFPPKYADPQEVLKRIREKAAEEVARDPLLNPRSQSP